MPEFLLVDDNADNRLLLAKTLIRKFPKALIQECQDSVPALKLTRRAGLTAAIVHRATDMDGIELVQALRKTDPTLPILYVSGFEQRDAALDAGAADFLNYDAWLRVGTVVEEMLRATKSAPPFSSKTESVRRDSDAK